jgi:hypothetical protein
LLPTYVWLLPPSGKFRPKCKEVLLLLDVQRVRLIPTFPPAGERFLGFLKLT